MPSAGTKGVARASSSGTAGWLGGGVEEEEVAAVAGRSRSKAVITPMVGGWGGRGWCMLEVALKKRKGLELLWLWVLWMRVNHHH